MARHRKFQPADLIVQRQFRHGVSLASELDVSTANRVGGYKRRATELQGGKMCGYW